MFRIFKTAVYFLNKKQLFTKAAQLSEHNLEYLIVSLSFRANIHLNTNRAHKRNNKMIKEN